MTLRDHFDSGSFLKNGESGRREVALLSLFGWFFDFRFVFGMPQHCHESEKMKRPKSKLTYYPALRLMADLIGDRECFDWERCKKIFRIVHFQEWLRQISRHETGIGLICDSRFCRNLAVV